MKKLLVLLLAVVLIGATACGGGGEPAATDEPASTDEPAATDEPASTESSYDQLMDIINNNGDILPLSGIQPKHIDSRADVPKALPPKEQKGGLTIGWTAASMGSSFFEGLMRSGKETAAKYGYTILEQNANFNLQTQTTQLDTFISQGVDAIVLNAVDLHSSTQDIKRAVDAGIPVFVTGPTAAKPEYEIVTAIISGSNESGYQVGYYCAEKLYEAQNGEPLKVGVVISKLPDADSNSRPCGWIAGYLTKKAEIDGTPYASKYDALLEAYNIWGELKSKGKLDISDKGLNFVGLAAGEGTSAELGQKASSDLLTAHPDMDLLFVEMDSMAVGALQEVKQHNMTPGEDIKVVTCADGTRESLEFIQKGELMATATNIPYYAGQGIIELIHKIFEEGYDANNLPATSFTPTEVINAENVDQFYDPNDAFAKVGAWEPITIDEYNAEHAND